MKRILCYILSFLLLFTSLDMKVYADEQPGTFSITSPGWGSTITSDFWVSWSSSSGADHYTISIKNVDTGGYVVHMKETKDTSYYVSYSSLTPGYNYTIGLVSYSATGVTRYGGNVDFYVPGGDAPSDFYITSPGSGEQYEEGDSVTIRWSDAANADYYVVNVRDLTTGSLIISEKSTDDTKYEISSGSLTGGHEYRAAVRAVNDYGEVHGGETVFLVKKVEAQPSYVSGMRSIYTITEGETLTLSGTIYGDSALTTVTADVTDGATSTGRVSANPNTDSYKLSNLTLDTSGLKAGVYTIRVWGKTANYDASSTAGTATLEVVAKVVEPSYVSGMSSSFTVTQGKTLRLDGKIYGGSDEELITVTADITDGSTSYSRVSYSPESKRYYLSNIKLDTSGLKPGTYTIRVWGKTASYDASSTAATATLTVEAAAVEPSYVSGMSNSFTISEGEKVTLNGTIYGGSGENLTTVSADVTDGATSTGRVSKNPNSTSYGLSNITIDTSSLKAGTYTIRVWGKTASYDASSTAATATLVVEAKSVEPSYVKNLSSSFTIREGEKVTLNGTIYGGGGEKLTTVSADVTDWSTSTGKVSKSPNATSYSLSNITLDTSSLKAGTYTIRVWGKTASYNAGSTAAEATLVVEAKVVEPCYVKNMSSTFTIKEGETLTLDGTIYGGSGEKLTKVTADATDGNNGTSQVTKEPNATSYKLSNITIDTSGLKAGTYTIRVWGKTAKDVEVTTTAYATLVVEGKEVKPSYVENMSSKFTIKEGEKVNLNGTIYGGGGEKLTTVSADVTDWTTSTGKVSKSPNAKSYSLSDITLDTSSLKAGTYTIRVWGKTASYDASSTAGTATLIVESKKIEVEPCYVKNMSGTFTITEGEKLTLDGTIYGGGGEKLTKVTADATDGNNATPQTSKEPNADSYKLSNITIDTSSLKPGTYTIRVWGKTAKDVEVTATAYATLIVDGKEIKPSYVENLSSSFTIMEGEKVTLNGTIYGGGGEKLTTVSADVTDWNTSTGKISKSPDSKSYSLSNITLDTSSLKAGTYTIRVWGKTVSYDASTTAAEAVLVVEEAKVGVPSVTDVLINDSYTTGDKFTIAGTVNGNGSNLESVYINVYYTRDTNYNYVLCDKTNLGTNTYKLDKVKSIEVGKKFFEKAGTYCIEIYAKNEGAAEAKLLMTKEIIVSDASATYVEGMDSTFTITEGQKLTLNGTIHGDSKLKTVSADVTTGQVRMDFVSVEPNKKSYDLSGITLDTSNLKAGKYFIRVWGKTKNYSAYDTAGSATLFVESAVLMDSPLGTFDITAPADGSAVSSERDLSLEWTNAENATYYRYAIYDVTTATNVCILEPTETSEKEVVIPAGTLKNGNRYTLQVVAYYDEATRWTEEVSIRVDDTVKEEEVIEQGNITINPQNDNGIITLFFDTDLSESTRKQVVRTNINYYAKYDGNSCPISKAMNGLAQSFCPDIDAGEYGVEVVYYGVNENVLAKGELLINYDMGIKNYGVSSFIQGEKTSVYGVISAVAGIAKVSGKVVDAQGNVVGKEKSLSLNANSTFNLGAKEFVDKLALEKLPAGFMKLVVTAQDTNGYTLVKDIPFQVKDVASPEVTGMLTEYAVYKGDILFLTGNLTSGKDIAEIVVSVRGEKDHFVRKAVSKKTYSLTGIALPTEGLDFGTYDAEVAVKLADDIKERVIKTFRIKIVSMFDELSYSDVDTNAWYYDILAEAVDRGIINAAGETSFRPNDCVSLNTFLSWCYGAMNISLSESEAFERAVQESIVMSHDAFYSTSSKSVLDRKSAAVIAHRIAAKYGAEILMSDNASYPKDVTKLEDPYLTAVKRMLDNGVMSLATDSKFEPNEVVSRASASAIALRLAYQNIKGLSKGTTAMNAILNQAIVDCDNAGLDEIMQLYRSFDYVNINENEGQGVLKGLWEVTYVLYNFDIDMVFGSGTERSIIKANLLDMLSVNKENMTQKITEAVKTGTGATEVGIETVMLFSHMTDAQAEELMKGLKDLLSKKSIDYIGETGEIVFDKHNMELYELIDDYLSLEVLDDIKLNSIKNARLPENVSELIREVKRGNITEAADLKKARGFTCKSLGKYAKYLDKTVMCVDVAVEVVDCYDSIKAYYSVTGEQIEQLESFIERLPEDTEDNPTKSVAKELLAELEDACRHATEEIIKSALEIGKTFVGDKALEMACAGLSSYTKLFECTQTVSNLLIGEGQQAKALQELTKFISANKAAVSAVVRDHGVFLQNPTEESLKNLCTSLDLFVSTSERCIDLGAAFKSDRILIFTKDDELEVYKQKQYKKLNNCRLFLKLHKK